MSDFIRRQREALTQSLPRAGQLAARSLGVTTKWGEIRIATDAAGSRLLVLPASSAVAVKIDRKSRGLHVVPIDEATRLRDGNAAILRCTSDEYAETFDDLVASLVAQAADYDGDPNALVARWRRSLSAMPNTATYSEILGVWGELMFAHELAVGGRLDLAWWTASFGGSHDYSLPVARVEVKTSKSSSPRRIRIHGIDQLTPVSTQPLLLRAYFVEEDPHGEGLSSLLGRLRDLGQREEDLLEALAKRGFEREQLAEFLDLRFSVRSDAIWLVDDRFPRLTRNSIAGGGNSSIFDVEYTIEVESLWAQRADLSVVFDYTG